MGEGMDLKTYSLRLDPEWFDLADKLVNDLSDTDAARAAGGQWGRAAVLRIACRRGLQELEAEAVALRKARRVPRRAKPSEDAP